MIFVTGGISRSISETRTIVVFWSSVLLREKFNYRNNKRKIVFRKRLQDFDLFVNETQ